MLADRNLAQLSSEKLYLELLRHMQVLWPTTGLSSGSTGRVRGRIKEAEGDGNPIGRTIVPTNQDLSELPEPKPPTKEYTLVGHWPLAHM